MFVNRYVISRERLIRFGYLIKCLGHYMQRLIIMSILSRILYLEPVTETKTVEVPITHEELLVERRPASESTTSTSDLEPPVTSKEEIKIPLKKEEVEVKKEPYVKEEVVLKKRRVTETKTITEEIKSERLADTSEKA